MGWGGGGFYRVDRGLQRRVEGGQAEGRCSFILQRDTHRVASRSFRVLVVSVLSTSQYPGL